MEQEHGTFKVDLQSIGPAPAEASEKSGNSCQIFGPELYDNTGNV
jgi:hypothetical protein